MRPRHHRQGDPAVLLADRLGGAADGDLLQAGGFGQGERVLAPLAALEGEVQGGIDRAFPRADRQAAVLYRQGRAGDTRGSRNIQA